MSVPTSTNTSLVPHIEYYDVLFRVEITTSPEESVWLTGSRSMLGAWDPHSAVPLQREADAERETWSTVLRMPSRDSSGGKANTVLYRYFACYRADGNSNLQDNLLITKWETFLRPRRVILERELSQDARRRVPSTFGLHDGKTSISRGWLTTQTEVRLNFHSNSLALWKANDRDGLLRMKVTAIDLRYPDNEPADDENSNEQAYEEPTTLVEFAILGDSNQCTFTPQASSGCVLYDGGQFIVFRVQSFMPQFLAFMIDIYKQDRAAVDEPPKKIGFAYILPQNLQNNKGHRTVPITGMRHLPIGMLKVDYLVIKPLSDKFSVRQTMAVSYQKHWKRRRKPLDIAHKGMGTSYGSDKSSSVKENTVASMQSASYHGADFVEFDVHLSRDRTPIVFHEFWVAIFMKKKPRHHHPSSNSLSMSTDTESSDRSLSSPLHSPTHTNGQSSYEVVKIPLKDFTLDQLQQLTLLHPEDENKDKSEAELSELMEKESESPGLHTFPTLEELFDTVDHHVAFNIEVKYPQQMQSGKYEQDMENYFELNEFCDAIIYTILKYGGTRRIVITCFDADVCIMFQRKQNLYPVMFLSSGETYPGERYADVRTHSAKHAVDFATAESLLGLSLYHEELLKEPLITPHLRSKQLILFVWGETMSTELKVSAFRKMDVDGIILDRISEFKQPGENVFHLEHQAKQKWLDKLERRSVVDVCRCDDIHHSPLDLNVLHLPKCALLKCPRKVCNELKGRSMEVPNATTNRLRKKASLV